MKKISTLIAALLCVISLSAQTDKRTKIELQTSMGKIIVELFNETPLHRDNFIKQVKAGTYNGVLWHRVINNFLIQTGDRLSKKKKQKCHIRGRRRNAKRMDYRRIQNS